MVLIWRGSLWIGVRIQAGAQEAWQGVKERPSAAEVGGGDSDDDVNGHDIAHRVAHETVTSAAPVRAKDAVAY
jgi:hypothetical protein